MYNLIKLELKKFKIKNNILAALICNVFILGSISLIFYAERAEGHTTFDNYNSLFQILGGFIDITFIIFAGFLISKFVIDEYKNKTICLLFSYPISRKKVIISKLFIVGIFTFCFTILSYLIVFPSFYFIQVITHTTIENLTFEMIFAKLVAVVTAAIANSMVGLIPLYFGMRKKSVPITILSSFLVAGILHSNTGGFTLSSIIIVPIIFSLIGIIIVYYSIRDIDSKDLMV